MKIVLVLLLGVTTFFGASAGVYDIYVLAFYPESNFLGQW